MRSVLWWLAWLPWVAAAESALPAVPVAPAMERAALQVRLPARATLQAADRAGRRIVAVGERGIVVLSDDDGQTWRQVPVPVSVGLTAVQFIDASQGWIAGHGGVVLFTADAGQTWVRKLDGVHAAQAVLADAQAADDPAAIADARRLVREGADKPLLDLRFVDARHGIAVGAYNLALMTEDAGETWLPLTRRLPNPQSLHLYSVRVRDDEVLIAGEQGLVLHSRDGGSTFQRLTVPYQGSFFTAELLGPGAIVVAGLRGNVLRSDDGGVHWRQVPTAMPVSITASAIDPKGRLLLANQAGVVYRLDGETLTTLSAGLPPINGLLPLSADKVLALSVDGAVPIGAGPRGSSR